MKNGEFQERKLELKMDLLNDLYILRESNIPGNILREDFKLNTIQLQELIHDLRSEGEPIIANAQKGYCYTKDRKRLMDYISNAEGRINAMKQAVDGLKSSLNIIEII